MPQTGRSCAWWRAKGLDAPDGIAVQDGEVWVADNASSAATEINAATGAAVSTFSDPAYGFWHPTAVIGTQGNVYVMTPLGHEPNGHESLRHRWHGRLVHVQHERSVLLQPALRVRRFGR